MCRQYLLAVTVIILELEKPLETVISLLFMEEEKEKAQKA